MLANYYWHLDKKCIYLNLETTNSRDSLTIRIIM